MQNNKQLPITIFIGDGECRSVSDYDVVINWSSFEKGNHVISIPGLVELKDKEYKEIYKSLLCNVADAGFLRKYEIRNDLSYWWLTTIVEKSQWKSPGLYNVFRLIALDDVLKDLNVKKIILDVNDGLIITTLERYCADHEVELVLLKANKQESTVKKPFLQKIPYRIRGIIYLVWYIKNYWVSRRAFIKNPIADKSLVFVSYLFNFKMEHAEQGLYASEYWGNLQKLVEEENIPSCWVHLYTKNKLTPTVNDAVKYVNNFNEKEDCNQHVLLSSLLSVSVLLSVVYDFLKLQVKSLGERDKHSIFKIHSYGISLWYVLEEDWRNSFSGEASMQSLLSLNLFERLIETFSSNTFCIYLMENQAWERCLTYYWKKHGNVRSIGVQHTALIEWDLRHLYNECESGRIPMPDYVALNGDAAVKIYEKHNFPHSKIRKAEALRFMYLNSINNNKSATIDQGKLRLLVLGDYLPKVTYHQMKMLVDAAKQLPCNIEVTVKAHPACPISKDDWPALNFKITNKPIDKLVADYDVAFASNITSASVDAYLSNKNVLVVLDVNKFNMCPLRGYEGVDFVSSADELVLALDNLKARVANQDHYFFTDPDLPYWKSLLEL